MNSMKHKHIRNILLLCLCAALLCGAAAAEEPAPVSALDTGLRYMDTLPDGRMLLGGFRNDPDSGRTPARLLCMNSDMTVSWDVEPEQEHDMAYISAIALPDGTIAAKLMHLYDDSLPDELRFFTQDGEPLEREMTLPVNGEYDIFFASETLLMVTEKDGGDFAPILLFDWDGNKIGQIDGLDLSRTGGMILKPDGFIQEITPEEGTREGKIIRIDFQGNVLWETDLPRTWTTKEAMGCQYMKETDDGEYMIFQSELMPHNAEGNAESRSTLTWLDSSGSVLRTESAVFRDNAELCMELWEYEGKFAALLYSYDNEQPGFRLDRFRICWLDGNGRELGSTELVLKPEDYDWMAEYAQDAADGKARIEMSPRPGMFAMQDGLWMLVDTRIRENGTGFILGDTWKDILVRVPEL